MANTEDAAVNEDDMLDPLLSALLFAGPSSAAVAPTPTPLVPANALIPYPVPSAAIADWTAAGGRSIATLDADGVMLRGWIYQTKDANAPSLLYFGGNGSTIEEADPILREIAARGARVLAFDYRGYGFSAGKADVMTFPRDALRLFDFAAGSAGGPQRVAVLGFSMGSAMATYVASEREVGGLILVAPIAGAKVEFAAYARANGMPPANADALVPASDAIEAFGETVLVAKSAAPLLVVHGDADTLVPFAQGQDVFAASRSADKRFVKLPGIGHNGALGAPQTLDAIGAFIATIR